MPQPNPPGSIAVAIIGAGPLGRWLALAAARAGFRVFLEDVMPSNLHHAQELIRLELSPANSASATIPGSESQSRSAESSKDSQPKDAGFSPYIQPRPIAGALAPEAISFVATIEDAVRHADLAIDCVPDELESKLEILWLLDRMCPPRTVLATPTTRLSIADLAACTYRPEKCIAVALDPRDFSGPPASAAITLRSTASTAAASAALVRHFWQSLGFAVTLEQTS